MTLFSENFLS